MQELLEHIKMILWGALFILSGFAVMNMPLKFFRGYEYMKDNPKEIKQVEASKRIVGRIFLVIGCLMCLYFLLIATLLTIVFLRRA